MTSDTVSKAARLRKLRRCASVNGLHNGEAPLKEFRDKHVIDDAEIDGMRQAIAGVPTDPREFLRALKKAEIGMAKAELEARFPNDPELEKAMHAAAKRKLRELGVAN